MGISGIIHCDSRQQLLGAMVAGSVRDDLFCEFRTSIKGVHTFVFEKFLPLDFGAASDFSIKFGMKTNNNLDFINHSLRLVALFTANLENCLDTYGIELAEEQKLMFHIIAESQDTFMFKVPNGKTFEMSKDLTNVLFSSGNLAHFINTL
jgi:hypothetical protein